MKKPPSKQPLFTIIACIVLIGAGVAAFLAFRSPINFTYYEPAYLPEGMQITEKRISVTGEGAHISRQAALRLETVAWSYSIRQAKANSSTTIGEAQQDFDETSITPTCSIRQSPKQQEYRLCHWVDDWSKSHGGGQVSVYEIQFIKGGTFFWGDIPTEVNKPIPVSEIDAMIDSFERKSIRGIPIKRSRYFV